MKHLKTSRSFIKEFKKQVRFAVSAAVGFSIAFAWRESIFDASTDLVSKFLNLNSVSYMVEIYTAITLTVVGVIFLLITSKLLKD